MARFSFVCFLVEAEVRKGGTPKGGWRLGFCADSNTEFPSQPSSLFLQSLERTDWFQQRLVGSSCWVTPSTLGDTPCHPETGAIIPLGSGGGCRGVGLLDGGDAGDLLAENE